MTVSRPRRGDFVRATTTVADTILPGQLLTAEGGSRFCSIATGACGALRAALFLLTPGPEAALEPRLVAWARGNGGESGEAPPSLPGVTADLLQKAMIRGQAMTSKDLLVQPIWLGQAGPGEEGPPPTAFLVLQAAARVRGARETPGSFTSVDRQRARIICLLAALKEEARSSSSQSEVLTRLSQAMAREGTVEGKLRQMTNYLGEVTQSTHACLWLQPADQRGKMRLRAVSGGQDEDRLGPAELPADTEAMQADLRRIAHFDTPAAVAVSALPWLTDILGVSRHDLGESAIVTPIRRDQNPVGVAISATAPGTTEHAAATMAIERVGLLRALADQIMITSEIALTSLDAQDRIRRYSLLAAIGEIALSKLGMEVMLDSILLRVQDHYDASSVYLYLLGSERSALRTRSVHRPDYASGTPYVEIKAHLLSNDKRIGTLQVRRAPSAPFLGPDHETLSQVADQVALSLTTSARYQLQASLAVLDSLTDLPNRRSGEAAFDRELERARQEHTYLSVALLDIDHFKSINDTFGHETGDTVLRDIARMFKVQVRATDHISRWGGEEFLILLPGSNRDTAQRVCERIRHSTSLVAARAANDKPVPVTASLGGATFPDDGEARETLLARADAALYRAKAAGRNRLYWAEHLE